MSISPASQPDPLPLLFQFGSCPRSKSVRDVLDYKRVRYATREVPLFGRLALWRLSGQNWPPVLLEQGHAYVHPTAIVVHLEQLVPAPAVLPADERCRGECLRLAGWIGTRLQLALVAVKYLEPANRTVALAALRRHYPSGYNRRLVGLVPLGQRLRLARLGYRTTRLAEIRRGLFAAAAAFEARLERQSFLGGGEPTFADFALHAAIWTLEGCAEQSHMLAANPLLSAWFARLQALLPREACAAESRTAGAAPSLRASERTVGEGAR